MLYLATAAGVVALEMDGEVGDLSVGKQFDAVWIGPEPRHPGRSARARGRSR
jgi:guanine deaminase